MKLRVTEDPYSDKFLKDLESANLKVTQLANEN